MDGVYTISNINENKEIRVNGIVDKTAPVVTINDIPSVMYGEKVVVSGTVIDVDGKPVTEGTVQVYVDDRAGGWPAVSLAADGSFICEISGVEAGEHIATATYFAEKTYVDASANKNFTVLAGHTHCICGGKSENHASHSAVTYTAWDGGEINYENGAAYLYIPADTTVTLENDITIGRNQTLYLCLNEKSSILASSGSAHFIINGAGARLVICSCRDEQGTFKGRTDGAGNGGCIEIREGNLDIYGGNIGYANCENGGVAYLKSKQCKMNIYGGSLCENTVKNGGAVYINSDNISQDYIGTVTMYGGVIENNNAAENGGAPNFYGIHSHDPENKGVVYAIKNFAVTCEKIGQIKDALTASVFGEIAGGADNKVKINDVRFENAVVNVDVGNESITSVYVSAFANTIKNAEISNVTITSKVIVSRNRENYFFKAEKAFARELENVTTENCGFTAPEVETKGGDKVELIDSTAE